MNGHDDEETTPEVGSDPPSDPNPLPKSTEPPSDDASESVADENPNSIARFFYNHNPFYLISCLLIIYGCQGLAIGGNDLLSKSLSMTGSIGAYTLLMMLVCIAVVRIAKVWEDARSIFIVVILSLVAMTTGFDELCIGQSSLARLIALATAALVVVVTEGTLRFCRVRLGFWYRAAYYAYFAVLIGMPLILGRAVQERNDPLANWGSFLFSVGIAVTILMLVPAMRRGGRSIQGNGTPWSWPLYPISAFVVMYVLAGIRAHAIWMSFGFYGVADKFEPFLLMPMIAATLVLIAETGLGTRNESLKWTALLGTPGLMLCGVMRRGATWLPIAYDIQFECGSAITICLGVMFFIYAWMAYRGIRLASFGLPATLMIAAAIAPMPRVLQLVGLENWMLAGFAALILAILALRRHDADWIWAGVGAAASTMTWMAGQASGHDDLGVIAAASVGTLSMLIIGAVYQTGLASFLRYTAAIVLLGAEIALLIRWVQGAPDWYIVAGFTVVVLSAAYAWLVARRGWLMIAGSQLVFCIAVLLNHAYRTGGFRQVNWPIAAGLVCLAVGVAITTGKTDAFQRFLLARNKRAESVGTSRFHPGL